ncbi:HNH endonuclease [Leucobacter sp. HY1908]
MLETFVGALWAMLEPNLWWLVPLVVVVAVLRWPYPGRGPSSAKRDSWRSFKYALRAAVFARAQGRCEGPLVLAWGRCARHAEHADHVYPWSKGGPTTLANGQALCAGCNRSKGARTPAWWYIAGLEHRRAGYVDAGVDLRVSAVHPRE